MNMKWNAFITLRLRCLASLIMTTDKKVKTEDCKHCNRNATLCCIIDYKVAMDIDKIQQKSLNFIQKLIRDLPSL